MERELLLPVKNSNYDKRKLENEIATMRKLLPYIESFKTFFLNNDVFDLHRHKLIKRWNKLRSAFLKGLVNNTNYYVFGRN